MVPRDHLKMERRVLDAEAGRIYAQLMPQERLLRAQPRVPLVDLRTVHDGLKAAILADFSDLIDSNAFTNGPHVAAFEQAFAEYCGARRCVGVASGLDALRLALLSVGLKQGDEVLLPANTFAATLEAVVQAGGTPVLVDVTERDYNIDVDAAATAITPRTRAILPVHLYGQLADMHAIESLAARHGLDVVADACQAHGATRDGLGAADGCRAAAFSFFPGKNLGAMGDAGALVTDDEKLAGRACALREHGQTAKYVHEESGYTARLDTVQALVLLHKLPQLDLWNEQRRAAALYYDSALEGMGDLRLPPVPSGSEPVWHLYVVRTEKPDRLARFLALRGISTGRHYPQPLHLLPAWRSLGHRPGEFPVTEALAERVLSMPLFPGIGGRQLLAVVEGIVDFFRHD
jgi:dTDP-4-amino-4,6-dideoxygalactose transaminase